jgi:hypothetical protein
MLCRSIFVRSSNILNENLLRLFCVPRQGCQIFHGTTYQNGEKYTKRPQNVPNGHMICILKGCQIFQMVIKYTNILYSETLQHTHKFVQGCQIFLSTTYQNGKNRPKDHKIYQVATKSTQWS